MGPTRPGAAFGLCVAVLWTMAPLVLHAQSLSPTPAPTPAPTDAPPNQLDSCLEKLGNTSCEAAVPAGETYKFQVQLPDSQNVAVVAEMAYSKLEDDAALPHHLRNVALGLAQDLDDNFEITCPDPPNGQDFLRDFLPSRDLRVPEDRIIDLDTYSYADQRDGAFVRLAVNSTRAFVVLRNCNTEGSVTVRLRISAKPSTNSLECPAGPGALLSGEEDTVCSGEGQCISGSCSCGSFSLGQSCEIKAEEVASGQPLTVPVPASGWKFLQYAPRADLISVRLEDPGVKDGAPYPVVFSLRQAVVPLERAGAPDQCLQEEGQRPLLASQNYITETGLERRRHCYALVGDQFIKNESVGFSLFSENEVEFMVLYFWNPSPQPETSSPTRALTIRFVDRWWFPRYLIPLLGGLACFFFLTAIAVTCIRVSVAIRNNRHTRIRPMSTKEIEEQLPSFPYRIGEGESPPAEHKCSICLCEITEGERLRKLPCEHMYHQPCVDPWICRHLTCPDCRTPFEIKSSRSCLSKIRFWKFRSPRSNAVDGETADDDAPNGPIVDERDIP